MTNLIDDFLLSNAASTSSVYEFYDDPVALSCAAYRQWAENRITRWPDLNDMTATESDREQAAKIRKYYADRLVVDMLKNKQISSFRQKLYGLVTNNLRLKKDEIGIVHRLPDFYAEDTALDQAVENSTPATLIVHGEEIQGQFVLTQRIAKNRKMGEYVQFCLKREADTALYMTMIKGDNMLLPLLNSVLQKPVQLKARVWTKQFRGHHRARSYYQLANLELI